MTTNPEPAANATPLLFVYADCDLPAISDGRWIEYGPGDEARLWGDIKSYLRDQLDLFRASCDYGECFAAAEYDVAVESLGEEELEVFRSTLAPEEHNTPLEELHSADTFKGLRAVVLHHLDAGTLDETRVALKLFNEIIESGIANADDPNPRSRIQIQTAREFVPWFIDHLLESVGSLRQQWGVNPYRRFVGEQFEHLKPLLDMLHRIVHREEWPRNDLALGGVLLAVDYFKQVVHDWSS